MSTFYLPVAVPETIQMAQSLSSGRQSKGKAAYNIIQCSDSGAPKWSRRQRGKGLLQQVANPEKLYVLLHGLIDMAGSPTGRVGAQRGAVATQKGHKTLWVGGTMRAYTPDDLAEHLEAEELGKQFIDLRVFCCHSGAPSAALGNHSFAAALKDSMRALGYNSIVVTGYRGALSSFYGHCDYERNTKGIRRSPAPHLTATMHKNVGIGNGQVASLHKVQFQ